MSNTGHIDFFDARSGRDMRYIYPDSSHYLAGWVLFRHPHAENWVTLRKASAEDIAAINKAVVEARHGGAD